MSLGTGAGQFQEWEQQDKSVEWGTHQRIFSLLEEEKSKRGINLGAEQESLVLTEHKKETILGKCKREAGASRTEQTGKDKAQMNLGCACLPLVLHMLFLCHISGVGVGQCGDSDLSQQRLLS